jgi:hypothetical protein
MATFSPLGQRCQLSRGEFRGTACSAWCAVCLHARVGCRMTRSGVSRWCDGNCATRRRKTEQPRNGGDMRAVGARSRLQHSTITLATCAKSCLATRRSPQIIHRQVITKLHSRAPTSALLRPFSFAAVQFCVFASISFLFYTLQTHRLNTRSAAARKYWVIQCCALTSRGTVVSPFRQRNRTPPTLMRAPGAMFYILAIERACVVMRQLSHFQPRRVYSWTPLRR